MKIGDEFPIIFKITRLAETGESIIRGEGGKCGPIDNTKRNLYWASSPSGSEILCCFNKEDDSPEVAARRKALVGVIKDQDYLSKKPSNMALSDLLLGLGKET